MEYRQCDRILVVSVGVRFGGGFHRRMDFSCLHWLRFVMTVCRVCCGALQQASNSCLHLANTRAIFTLNLYFTLLGSDSFWDSQKHFRLNSPYRKHDVDQQSKATTNNRQPSGQTVP